MFKKLFCKHKYTRCLTNLYGDYINYLSKSRKTYRSIWVCDDCGKIIYKEKLEPTCYKRNEL